MVFVTKLRIYKVPINHIKVTSSLVFVTCMSEYYRMGTVNIGSAVILIVMELYI